MTQADIVSLVQLCKETALYFKACKMIENLGAAGEVYLTPTGTWARNPWLMIRKQAFESSGKRMAEFGLNPADRTRVGIAKAEKSPGGKYGGLRD
jgi:P27 family predicted phage terminase small subunit